MITKSLKDGKVYKIEREKRYKERKGYNFEISFPVLNGSSFKDVNHELGQYLMKTTDITEFGIGIRSNIMLKEGDFLNISLKVNMSPIFECMCIVKWVGVDDESYLAGCEFCNIRNEDRTYIRQFMSLDEAY
ncbi:MAG: PilZ domain-containing protein [Clostridiaceae bacterium]